MRTVWVVLEEGNWVDTVVAVYYKKSKAESHIKHAARACYIVQSVLKGEPT